MSGPGGGSQIRARYSLYHSLGTCSFPVRIAMYADRVAERMVGFQVSTMTHRVLAVGPSLTTTPFLI